MDSFGFHISYACDWKLFLMHYVSQNVDEYQVYLANTRFVWRVIGVCGKSLIPYDDLVIASSLLGAHTFLGRIRESRDLRICT